MINVSFSIFTSGHVSFTLCWIWWWVFQRLEFQLIDSYIGISGVYFLWNEWQFQSWFLWIDLKYGFSILYVIYSSPEIGNDERFCHEKLRGMFDFKWHWWMNSFGSKDSLEMNSSRSEILWLLRKWPGFSTVDFINISLFITCESPIRMIFEKSFHWHSSL